MEPKELPAEVTGDEAKQRVQQPAPSVTPSKSAGGRRLGKRKRGGSGVEDGEGDGSVHIREDRRRE